jgi:carbonic anhydrase
VHACHDMCAGRAPELEAQSRFLGRWMDILRPGYDRVVARVEGEAEQKVELEREAVLVSLQNLGTFPFVAEAQRSGMLTLHGTWFDIGTGELHVWNAETGFVPI